MTVVRRRVVPARTGPIARLAAALVLLMAAGCGGDDAAVTEEEAPLVPDELAPVTVPPPVEEPSPGEGVLSIGGLLREFDVLSCDLEPGSDTFFVNGAGETDGGVPFQVEVQRFVSGQDPVTTSDLVNYEDTARVLQAQRAEVEGGVTDLRDPQADAPLLEVRRRTVSGGGIAGPPGSREGDEGLVGLSFHVSC
jgi:hypothetical protein